MKMDFNWESVNGLARALGGRVELLEKVFKEKGLTPAMIQKIVASGFASDFFDIGDEIIIPWTDYSVDPPVTYEVPHIVVHFGDVEDPEGNIHKNAMWLMWKYATPNTIQFDSKEVIPETESTFQEGYYYYTATGPYDAYEQQQVEYNTEIPDGVTYYKHVLPKAEPLLNGGSSAWADSALRQWLNSCNEKGEWWQPNYESDLAPQELSSLPGFLTGYEEDFISIIKPVKIISADYTAVAIQETCDRFFIPTRGNMNGEETNAFIDDCTPWEYWIKVTGFNVPNNAENNGRIIKKINDINGSGVNVFTRSSIKTAMTETSSVIALVRCKNTDGNIKGGTYPSVSYYQLPSCVIY